ncbi:MAG: hypothetical protein H7256_04525 [Bdellovibrio sp.]|nr:hypothetical protein [Bdellovibrio sp.]
MYDQIGGGESSPIKQKLWTVETFVEELSILTKKWKLEKFNYETSEKNSKSYKL